MAFDNLVANSTIEIYQFDVHEKEEMKVIDRVLPYYVMSYLKKGRALLRIDGEEYSLQPKSMIIIPAGVKHDHICLESAVFLWWHFNFKLYQTLDLLKVFRLPVMFNINDAPDFEQTFEQYIALSNTAGTLKNVVQRKAKAFEIMAILLGTIENETINRPRTDVPDSFYTIFEEITTCKKGGNISLTKLAKKHNMHPTYISNQFKKIFGIAPISLYREIQRQRATYMLTDRNMSVSDVADALGFSDSSTFSRFYAAGTGKSPSQAAREKQAQPRE